MTSTATKVAQVIIERIEKSVRNKPYGQIMLENILDEAQELVNTDGYRWGRGPGKGLPDLPGNAERSELR